MRTLLKAFVSLSAGLVVLAIPGCSSPRPTVGTIENFDRVDSHVYRGAQPTQEGFQYLAGLGVKTVIDLREADNLAAAEKQMVEASGMQFVNVPMTGHTPPTDEQIEKILAILDNSATGPVFVHCKRGADRTGAVIAAYHIQHDQWSNDQALKDANSHDMGVFQGPRREFIRRFQRSVLAGAPPAATQAAGNNNQ